MHAPSAPDRVGHTLLPDGRALGWAEWGPRDGTPVLLCPGAGMSCWIGFATDAVDELGVRLVSADRPGLGASDPSPDRTLADWPGDVAALGLWKPAVVGYSQGAPFAFACAAAGITDRLAIVAGTDELVHPAFAGSLDDHLDGLLQAAAADPADFEAQLASMTPAALLTLIRDMSAPTDRALYAEPAFATAYARAVEEAFAQGGAGYARDTVLAFGAWPFRVEDVRIAVDLWYGALDTSPSHSPDHGATLARRLPDARRHLLDDEGGALLFTRGREILEALVA